MDKAFTDAVKKLKSGTWIKVKWDDSPEPTLALFLNYVSGDKQDGTYSSRYRGDRTVLCWYPHDKIHGMNVSKFAVHTQVVEILGPVVVPI